MIPVQCDKYQKVFKEILGLRESFIAELKKDQTDRDNYLLQTRKAKEKKEESKNFLEQILDVYEIKLRLEITRREGYNFVGEFSERGVAWAKYKQAPGVNGVYYLINKKGERIDTFREPFREVEGFKEGLAIVETTSGVNYFINEKGEIVLGPFREASSFCCGLALIKDNDLKNLKYKYIDKKGNLAFGDKSFDEALPFSPEGLAAVREGNNWFFINTRGEKAFKGNFLWAEPFSEGYAAVQFDVLKSIFKISSSEKSWAFVDTKGRKKLERKFEGAVGFYDGFGKVRRDGKDLVINKDGKIILNKPLRFAFVHQAWHGLVLVNEKMYKNYFINREGQNAFGEEYTEAIPFMGGLARVKQNGVWYFMDKKGRKLGQVINEWG